MFHEPQILKPHYSSLNRVEAAQPHWVLCAHFAHFAHFVQGFIPLTLHNLHFALFEQGFMRKLCTLCSICTLHTLCRVLCAHFQIYTVPSKICLAAVCALRCAVSDNHCVFCNLNFGTSKELQCPDFRMKSSTTMVFIILLIFTV